MSSMHSTQVNGEPAQKKALTVQATKSGRKVSKIMRGMVGVAIEGVTLDKGTQRAMDDVNAVLAQLKNTTSEHIAFIRDTARLKKITVRIKRGQRISILSLTMDRLADTSSLWTQCTELIQQRRELRRAVQTQQRQLVEVAGQARTLIQMHSAVSRR
jgi:hypothetical protein